MEADGVVAEVIFPNTIPPFYPKSSLTFQPPAQTPVMSTKRWAGLQAHNRWLADFCSEVPGRRAGIAQILLARHPCRSRRGALGEGGRAHRRHPASRRAAELRSARAVRRRLLRTAVGRVRRTRHAGQPPWRQCQPADDRRVGVAGHLPARGDLVLAPRARSSARQSARSNVTPICSWCSPSRARRGFPTNSPVSTTSSTACAHRSVRRSTCGASR